MTDRDTVANSHEPPEGATPPIRLKRRSSAANESASDGRAGNSNSSVSAWLEAHRVDVSGLKREDIVGIGHVTTEIGNLVVRLREPERASAMGVESPRGILFWGAPGLGKTLVARWVAVALGESVPFYEVSADELTPARIRGALAELSRNHPRSVLYIDEIDTFGMARDYGGHDPKTRLLLTATLAALDGLRPSGGPVVIASSNRSPGHLDVALVRSGRLGFKVAFDHPTEYEREALLRLFARRIPCAVRMGWRDAARLTRNSTPADLRQLMADAAGLALAAGRDRVRAADLRLAIRRSGRIEPEETVLRDWPRMAIHEAGHVAVAVALRGPSWVYAVKLGVAGGATNVGDEERDSSDWPDDELVDTFAVGFGGLAAERLLLGSATEGSSADMSTITRRALDRFAAGLSEEIPVAPEPFDKMLAESTKESMARAARSVIEEGQRRAGEIVAANEHAIRRFADVLVAAGELTGPSLFRAIGAAGFSQPGQPGKPGRDGASRRTGGERHGGRAKSKVASSSGQRGEPHPKETA
jgi:cell division protease FtsH